MPSEGTVFISYSHVDKEWLDMLCVHLRPLEQKHRVEIWSDSKLVAGQRWRDEIAAALARARVAILLVSAYFLASDFVTTEELPSLLRAAQEEGTVILPLILSHCGFLRDERLREFQAINDPHHPLIKLTRGDQEEILEKLAALVEAILSEPTGASRTRRTTLNDPFNLGFVFSNFVIGSSNEFACAAAEAVAKNPSQSYNPLFIYSTVGLGKTHLLHAIGQEIAHSRPELRVLYLAAEQFTNELIDSIRFNRMAEFRERYRTTDVLIIDDVQFLANKERTQEEFFHTFNTLYTSQKQIILSSDSSPRNIPTLEERLRSRFEWGLIADMQPPDLETKVAILQRKAAIESVVLPDEVAALIAKQVRSNVRELEGILHRILARCSMAGKPPSIDFAREALEEILPSKRPLTPASIIALVARSHGLRASEVRGSRQARQLAFPRSVAMYLCKALTNLSFYEIGLLFNGRHHSTVREAVGRIKQLRDVDPNVDRVLCGLEESLTSGFASSP
jgi:chromosomal replication initiator protein